MLKNKCFFVDEKDDSVAELQQTITDPRKTTKNTNRRRGDREEMGVKIRFLFAFCFLGSSYPL